MKPPYSAHLLQWTPLYNGYLFQELMKPRSNAHNKTLCNGHLIAGTSIQRRSFLGPNSLYPLELTHLQRRCPVTSHYKTFTVRNLQTFYFCTILFMYLFIFYLQLTVCRYNPAYNQHCMKSVQIRSFFWSVFFCIQSKYRKMRTRKCSVFGQFSRSASTQIYL